MNRREAKRRIFAAMATTLSHDFCAAEWVWQDVDGKDLSEADLRRMDEAIEEIVEEFERRAGPHGMFAKDADPDGTQLAAYLAAMAHQEPPNPSNRSEEAK
jgi:hypothetical protein